MSVVDTDAQRLDGTATRPAAQGFVVAVCDAGAPRPWFERGDTPGGGPPDAWRHYTIGRRTVSVFAQPWPTTPEAEHETQPVELDDLVCVYDGRIDNRAEIASRLGLPSLASAADGTVLAKGFHAWGTDVGAHALGEFVGVCLDRTRGSVTAFRDPLGLRHLYVATRGAATWLASDLELLLAQWTERPPLDRDAVAEYFTSPGHLLSGRTLLQGIHELKAAHQIVWAGDAPPRTTRYWTPVERDLVLAREEDYDERLRELLFEGVRPALRANGAVVCELSGGLDSSTVASIAALSVRGRADTDTHHAPDHPKGLFAYSLVFDETHASPEGACQEAVARQHGLERIAIDHEGCRPFDLSGAMEAALPTHLLAYGGLQRRLRTLAGTRHVRACLTGVGGDQLFGSHGTLPPLMLADLLRQGRFLRWCRETSAWSRHGTYSLWTLVSAFSRGRLPRHLQDLRLPAWLTQDFRNAIVRQYEAALEPPERLFDSPARECSFQKIVQMAHSCRPKGAPWEERHPLFYRPLVEYMLAVPWRLKVLPGKNRILQRRALGGILPDEVRLRTTTISFGPLLLRGFDEHWQSLQPLIDGTRLGELGIVEPGAFREACRRARLGMPDQQNIMLYRGALTLEAWLRGQPPQRLGES